MEGHRNSITGIDQCARDRGVDLPSGIQRTDYDPVRPFGTRYVYVTLHHLHLLVGVDEPAAAWTNQDEGRNAKPCFHRSDQSGAGRSAAVAEIRAQLDASRSCALGDDRRAQCVDSGLDECQVRFSEAMSMTKRYRTLLSSTR